MDDDKWVLEYPFPEDREHLNVHPQILTRLLYDGL